MQQSKHIAADRVMHDASAGHRIDHARHILMLDGRIELSSQVVFDGDKVKPTGGAHTTSLSHRAGSITARGSPVAAILRMSSVIRIEQYLGPHMLQKWALLKVSCGSVSSCMRRAVSGSSDKRNCSFQSNPKRARLKASSRSREPLRPRARSAAWAAIL